MVSVIVKDNSEPNVTQFTFEHLYTELKDIPGSELLIMPEWDVSNVKNRYVCLVEADCLVSKGFFKQQIEAFSKLSPRVVVLAPKTAVKYWNNNIYGYYLAEPMIIPVRKQKANRPHPLQIAYIPGSLIRTNNLKKALKNLTLPQQVTDDLVYYSSLLSLGIWSNGISVDEKHPSGQLGTQLYINPSPTYVTTEEYVNDIADLRNAISDRLLTLFAKESI